MPRPANVFTFSRERGLMAARLSAPTQSHNHSPRDKSGYRSRHAGDGLARRLQRAVRRSDEPAITSLLVGEYPVARIAPKSGAALAELCNPTRSMQARAMNPTTPVAAARPSDRRALRSAGHPELHSGRGRNEAGANSAPLMKRGQRLGSGLRPGAIRTAGSAPVSARCPT